MKDIKIILSKAFQNVPKLGGLVWKQTIWQPCNISGCGMGNLSIKLLHFTT
jgi:hypothetical protein